MCLSSGSPCIGVQECDEAEGYCFTPVEAIQNATWLVFASSDFNSFVATAFGVGENLFATNAHVTEALVELFGEPNAEAWLYQHETGLRRAVSEVWSHPEFDGDELGFNPDVGLLQARSIPTSPSSFEPLMLAEDATLRSLGVFDEVFLCGFPRNLTEIDLVRPRATCLQGTISALRPFNPAVSATPDNTFLIQYDLPTVPGTSGSAVFDDRGAIIGVNSFGAGMGGDSNFAIRSDKLQELMSWAESGLVQSTVLADVEPNIPPCQTSYFNSEWQFGFDLPVGFSQIASVPLPDSFFFAAAFRKTVQPQGDIRVGVIDASGHEQVHMAVLELFQDEFSAEIVATGPFVTANGVPAFLTILQVPDESSGNPLDDFYHYLAHTDGMSGVHEFWGYTRLFNVPLIGPTLQDAALSLCTESSRTTSSNQPRLNRRNSSEMDRATYERFFGEEVEHFGDVNPPYVKKSENE
ncbi:MAG: serine protease [Planctomycetota bacterium]|nr:serine protease [Planctomycetota bacterium]